MIGCHCHSPKRFGCGIWLRLAAVYSQAKIAAQSFPSGLLILKREPFHATDITLMSAGPNTALLMNGTIEVMAPLAAITLNASTSAETSLFKIEHIYSFIRDWDGG
jgi:hypothetical protein